MNVERLGCRYENSVWRNNVDIAQAARGQGNSNAREGDEFSKSHTSALDVFLYIVYTKNLTATPLPRAIDGTLKKTRFERMDNKI